MSSDGDRHMTGRTLARQLGQWRGDGVAYVELAERIKLLVQDGRLPTRTRVPAERELAVALAVSRTTVAAGYDLLRQDGVLHSRRGAGSWTAQPDTPGAELSPFAPVGDDSALDMAYACPGPPAEPLNRAMAWAGEQMARSGLGAGYQLLGQDGLRAAVAERFTRRGVPTTADQILVTSGAMHAFSLVLATLVAPGDRVLVEHPTYPNALDAITRVHARAVPVGFGDPGDAWDLDTLAATVRDASPRLAYLMPDFHNPTGRCMPPAQREEVVELCRRTRTTLVVDETVSELVLDGEPPTPMAAFGPRGGTTTVVVGSLSKPVWGGLRIGWARAARPLVERLARARAAMDLSSPVLEQLMGQHLLGHLDEVLATRLPQLRDSRDTLRRLLAQRLPEWTTSDPAGGLSLWSDLGAPVSSALVTAAAREGVLLAAGPRFGVDGAFERHLRVPFTLPETQLELAVRRIATAWSGRAGAGPATAGWDTPRIEVA